MKKIISRYKPLYKKFIRLRKNVQNRQKLNKGLLKKKKWDNLNTFLSRLIRRRKKNFRTYDLTCYPIQRYGTSFKRKFLLNLLIKQRLSMFYGILSDHYLKCLIKTCKNTCLKKKETPINLLVKILESRLDTVLYRSHFVKSLREARLVIQHGHVFVNGYRIYDNKYSLSKGDFIKVSLKYSSIVKQNLLSSNLWPLPPKYLIVNFKTFSIIYKNKLQITNLSSNFSFHPDFNSIINYHKYK